jgi:hypothetical protein
LTTQEVADAIAAGRFEQDQKNLSVEDLTKALGNWSPTVRCRAAWELATRPDTRCLVPHLITAAEGPDAWLRMGACEALGQFKAPEALPVLIRLLHHEDRGLRWLAARALGNFDDAAAPHVEALLQALITNAQPNDPIDWSDPLQFANFTLSKILFNGNITAATAKARKDLLLPALRVAMQLPTGYARSQISNFIGNLTVEEAQTLGSHLLEAVSTVSPADTMFSNVIRMEGVKTLTKYHFKEGITAAVDLAKTQGRHGSESRTGEIMKMVTAYGTAARPQIPALRELIASFNSEVECGLFPGGELNNQRVGAVEEAIKAIEAATDQPELRSLAK